MLEYELKEQFIVTLTNSARGRTLDHRYAALAWTAPSLKLTQSAIQHGLLCMQERGAICCHFAGVFMLTSKATDFPQIFHRLLVLQIALFVQAFLILGNLPCFLRPIVN
jgi:hypothetical protein